MPVITFLLEAFALAVLIDLFFGEPRPALHPVVWIGSLIGFLKERPPRRLRRAYGFVILGLTVALAVAIGSGLSLLAYLASPALSLLVTAYLLKSTFSLSFLWGVSRDIFGDLAAGRLDAARARLPALVGRDVSRLDAGQMSSCVVESLGESFVDGIMAPIFWFVLLGLPGALAYRAVNTLDSMVGYKDEKHREIGFASAKADDLANYLPARLSLPLIAAASALAGSPGGAARVGLRDARKTPSGNSGFPMASFAGALGLRLEKLGYYVLGEGLRPCTPADIPRAIRLNQLCSALLIVVVAVVVLLTGLPFTGGWFAWPAIW
jgi:adenosylcobinamide-phosphate synthase